MPDEVFNLLEENWIPVLYEDGRFERVGILRAFTDSGRIRQIAASNPMDRVAILRFLLAVLLWCRNELTDSDREMLKDGAAGIPVQWLNKLQGHKTAFNLLGDGERFYQDASLKADGEKKTEPRPVADLLVEFPGADSVNFMRHVVHDSCAFCPACCALGILRLSVWASANRYYPASVNPGSAAYAIAKRKNLLLILDANLPEGRAKAEQAPWLLSSTPPDSPDAVAYLAWRPRKLWLNVAPRSGPCANCGSCGMLIENLYNEGGWPTPTTDGQRLAEMPAGRATKGKQDRPGDGDTKTKKFWDADPHLLKDREPTSLPGLNANVAAHTARFWRDALRLRGARTDRVEAIGPVVNKFVFQDAVSVALPDYSGRARAEVSTDYSKKLYEMLKRTTPNSGRQHPEINAALVLLTPQTEARILSALNDPAAAADDTAFLHKIYEPLVEQVVASTVRGSPLRRREAVERARSALDKALRKITSSQRQDSSVTDNLQSEMVNPTQLRRRKKEKESVA